MVEESSKNKARTLRVQLRFPDSAEGEKIPPIRVYLFDRQGNLIDSQPYTKETFNLRIPSDQNYRLYVGPDLLGEEKISPKELLQQLGRAKAVLQDILAPLRPSLLEIAISRAIHLCWWRYCVIVRGNVRKQFAPGTYATICQGTVKIYEVDFLCYLQRLPLPELERLRDDLLDLLRRPPFPPLPQPIPFPFPEPNPPFPPIPPGPGPDPAPFRQLMFQPASEASSSPAFTSASLSDVAVRLAVLKGEPLQRYLVQNKVILAPYLCLILPDYFYCLRLLAEVPIQSDGSFYKELCFWCPSDIPDLYFRVTQNLGGTERLVYSPPIACNTYWDYNGTPPIQITVTDPQAVACLEDPDRPIPGDELYVWPTAIGNIDLRNITDLESNPLVSTAATGLVNGATPWGGTLALQMNFDPRLKTLSNVRYYRWSYKFEGDSDFTQINATVTHRYMTITYSPLTIHLHPVVLGPKTVNGVTNLYDVPDPSPGDGWVNINDPYDRPFAYFDSTGNNLPPFTYNDVLPRRSGLVTLLLEMFDASGNLVPCSNLGGSGPFKFVLPDLGSPNAYTSVLTPNNITPQGQLMFRVRVDNADTVSQLQNVRTPLGTADSCGFLRFNSLSDLVSVEYVARHPNNFLTWGLGISRGLCGGVASTSGSTSSPALPPPPPATFANTASHLLRNLGGSCTACNDGAAFAVNLSTYATATDGYGRQSQYDRHATIAFALIRS